MAKQKTNIVQSDQHGGVVLKAGVDNRVEWPADPRFKKDVVVAFQAQFISLNIGGRIENAGDEKAVFVVDLTAEQSLFPQRESRYVVVVHDGERLTMEHRGALIAD